MPASQLDRLFPDEKLIVLCDHNLVEEETVSVYNPKSFYPLGLDEIFENRWQIDAKLGFGTRSTIWLGRDVE
jgi:serine/threonine-protein kinase SRPK3